MKSIGDYISGKEAAWSKAAADGSKSMGSRIWTGTTRLDTAIRDTVDITRTRKASRFGQWLNHISQKHPTVGKVVNPVRNFFYNVHRGAYFNPKLKLRTGVKGNITAVKSTTSWTGRLGAWLAKRGPVGQFVGKALQNPLKGPVFMTALIDGVLSIGTAIKDTVQVTKEKGFFSGLWAGAKSLFKSAAGIAGGVLAAGATALAVGTGPLGWILGTAAYIGGSWLGNKLVGSVLPVRTSDNQRQFVPGDFRREPMLNVSSDQVAAMSPAERSAFLDYHLERAHNFQFYN